MLTGMNETISFSVRSLMQLFLYIIIYVYTIIKRKSLYKLLNMNNERKKILCKNIMQNPLSH